MSIGRGLHLQPPDSLQLVNGTKAAHMCAHLGRAKIHRKVNVKVLSGVGACSNFHNTKHLWVCLRVPAYTGNCSFWRVGWGLEWEGESPFSLNLFALFTMCMCYLFNNSNNNKALNTTVSDFCLSPHCTKLLLWLLFFCKSVTWSLIVIISSR